MDYKIHKDYPNYKIYEDGKIQNIRTKKYIKLGKDLKIKLTYNNKQKNL